MKIRIKFSKEGNLRFVGHLDMMCYFQKASRCMELPVAYSEGFYPHQIMSFMAPFGTDLRGEAEYFDPRIMEEGAATLHSAGATEYLNREMAEGIRILSFLHLPDDSLNCMSIVHAADYEALFRAIVPEDETVGQFVDGSICRSPAGDEERSLHVAVDKLLQREEIPAQRTGKKENLRELDLRPMIHTLCYEDSRLRCTATQGSKTNLKLELLLLALFPLDIAHSLVAMLYRVICTELHGNAGKTLESYGTVFRQIDCVWFSRRDSDRLVSRREACGTSLPAGE